MSRLNRSVLYVPATNARALVKSRDLRCDWVVIDLEDAVAPGAKAEARKACVETVKTGGFRPHVAVRINDPKTDEGQKDRKALRGLAISALVIPKVETASEVTALLADTPDTLALWPMIETPSALLDLREIGQALRPGDGLMLGTNDLALALGAVPDPDRLVFQGWMALMVAVARLYDLIAIDGVFNAIDDTEGLKAEAEQAIQFGFDGKSLIHPSQTETINRAFSPSDKAVARAKSIVSTFEHPDTHTAGVIRHEGQMVERLHLKQARELLARHQDILSRKT